MRWFQALLPREDRFFGYFIEHARLLLKAAEAQRELLAGGDGVPAACATIMAHEEAADAVTREVMLAVRRTLITPFDRSDIRDLTTALDDAIDQSRRPPSRSPCSACSSSNRRCANWATWPSRPPT